MPGAVNEIRSDYVIEYLFGELPARWLDYALRYFGSRQAAKEFDMGVTYRVLSPDVMWRSDGQVQLTVSERDGLVYLLTSPFSTLIGLYPISLRVASAEMGLSVGEFEMVLERLERLNFITRSGTFVLVNVWFQHTKYAAVLRGKVKPRALDDLRKAPAELRQRWVTTSQACGVPKDDIDVFLGIIPEGAEVTSKGLASSFNAPSKEHPLIESSNGKGVPRGINTETETKTETQTETTTTTETKVVVVGQNNNQETTLELGELAEPHRALLVEISDGLSEVQRQELGDEVSQRLQDALQPDGKPVFNVRGWAKCLVDELGAGRSVLNRGLHLARAREARRNEQLRSAQQAQHDEYLRDEAAAARALAQEILSNVDSELLSDIMRDAEVHAPSPKVREIIRQLVSVRQLPSALAGGLVMKVIKHMSEAGLFDDCGERASS